MVNVFTRASNSEVVANFSTWILMNECVCLGDQEILEFCRNGLRLDESLERRVIGVGVAVE